MTPLGASQKAPDFELADELGRPVRASDLWAQGPLVLFFYPKDETVVCTREACNFRDQYSEFQELGARIYGVSRDSQQSHASFKAHHGLPYPLLTDIDGQVARSFGVGAAFGLLPGRSTFVIDSSGVIVSSFTASLAASEHVRVALEALRGLVANSSSSPGA